MAEAPQLFEYIPIDMSDAEFDIAQEMAAIPDEERHIIDADDALNNRVEYSWESTSMSDDPGDQPHYNDHVAHLFTAINLLEKGEITRSLGNLLYATCKNVYEEYVGEGQMPDDTFILQGFVIISGFSLDYDEEPVDTFHVQSGVFSIMLDLYNDYLNNASDIADRVELIVQSPKRGETTHITTKIAINWYITPPAGGTLGAIVGGGGGKKSIRCTGPGSHSCLKIPSYEGDFKCCARALMLLWQHKIFFKKPADARTESDKKEWNLFRGKKDKPNLRSARALTASADSFLIDQCGFEPDDINRPIGSIDMPCLQRGLTKMTGLTCHINVFSTEDQMGFVYSTFDMKDTASIENSEDIEWFDVLLTRHLHYHAVTKINRLLGNQNNFCYKCRKTYQKRHSCTQNCVLCKSTTDHMEIFKQTGNREPWKQCDECQRSFYGEACFTFHKESSCKIRWKCLECGKTFRRRTIDGKVGTMNTRYVQDPDEHKCSNTWCTNCQGYVEPSRHQCYMKTTEPQKPSEKYLFADFECTQDNKTHEVNLAITMTFTGEQWPIHHNISEWVDMLLQPRWRGYTVIFHNGKGYDFQFIISHICTSLDRSVKVQPIMVGGKILYCTITQAKKFTLKSGIRLVDSLNFLPMALTKFTATFGLKTRKGFYPHLYNTNANKYSVVDIPDKKYFGLRWMSKTKVQEFDSWYEDRSKREWNNFEELVAYCQADVQLLREGCIKFRQLVMSITTSKHDPFQEVTLASSAMKIFRTEMMDQNTVAAFDSALAKRIKGALSGGRTGASKLYMKASDHEEMHYVDFTSAYPYICKTGLYPKGHPDIIWDSAQGGKVEELPDMKTGVSLWEVDIACPQNLYHPLLHYKDPETGRLLFDLRPKRKIMYTSMELNKALQLGYVITKVHYVCLWKSVIRGIFASYINKFLKIKQESSGYPPDVDTPEKRGEYIRLYKEHEGVSLDYKNIAKNKGKYAVSKLYLNSLWGKFGQRMPEEFSSTKILFNNKADQRQLYNLRSKELVQHIHYISDFSAIVRCSGEPTKEVLGNVNIALAIFTTAQARLLLYNKLLEPLGRRVCYYDTDSCIFKCDKKELPVINRLVPLGKYLGEITNELGQNKYAYNDEYIIEFASGGPKNYGYLTNKEIEVAKIKGHSTKQVSTAKLLNFQAIKNVVLGNMVDAKVPTLNFVRDRNFTIRTTIRDKMYKLHYNKRHVLPPWYGKHGIVTCVDTEPWKTGQKTKEYKLPDPKKRKVSSH